MDKMDFDPEDFDPCYECTGLGDDYYFDADGELVPSCPECPFCDWREDDDD